MEIGSGGEVLAYSRSVWLPVASGSSSEARQPDGQICWLALSLASAASWQGDDAEGFVMLRLRSSGPSAASGNPDLGDGDARARSFRQPRKE